MTDAVFGLETQPAFPAHVPGSFADADMLADAHEREIQRQSRAALSNSSAWGEYLRKVLSPTDPQPTMRVLRASRA